MSLNFQVHKYMYVHGLGCIFTQMCAYIYINVHTYTYIYIYTQHIQHTHVHTHTCIHTFTHTYNTHVHTHIHTYKHTNIHKHIHTTHTHTHGYKTGIVFIHKDLPARTVTSTLVRRSRKWHLSSRKCHVVANREATVPSSLVLLRNETLLHMI